MMIGGRVALVPIGGIGARFVGRRVRAAGKVVAGEERRAVANRPVAAAPGAGISVVSVGHVPAAGIFAAAGRAGKAGRAQAVIVAPVSAKDLAGAARRWIAALTKVRIIR
jgi:hypothetical protein